MVLYMFKPLWKSFWATKDDSCDAAAPVYTTAVKEYPNDGQSQSQRVNRSQTQTSKKSRGPKIRIHPPAQPGAVAPGTGEKLPYDDALLAAPLPSEHSIDKVFAATTSPVSLRRLSPVEFLPTLDALRPARATKGAGDAADGGRFAMSSRRSLKALASGSSQALRRFARPTKTMLADGRTEPAKAALARALCRVPFFSRHKQQPYVPRLLAQQGAAALLPTPATRRRASGVWVRDRHGNPFWMNGMLARDDEPEGPAATTPRTVLLGAGGAPELAVSVAAFSARRKSRFGRVRLYLK